MPTAWDGWANSETTSDASRPTPRRPTRRTGRTIGDKTIRHGTESRTERHDTVTPLRHGRRNGTERNGTERNGKSRRRQDRPARASRLTETDRRPDAIRWLIHRIAYRAHHQDIAIRAALLAAERADTPHRTKSDCGTIDRTGKRGEIRLVDIVCFSTCVRLCVSAPCYIGDGGEGRIRYEVPSSKYMRPALLAAGRAETSETKQNIAPLLDKGERGEIII